MQLKQFSLISPVVELGTVLKALETALKLSLVTIIHEPVLLF